MLLPLALIYGALVVIRKWLYRLGVLSTYQAPVPVMVVGNITVGGTGKTPLTIHLVKRLQARGIKVGVVSRGYGRQVISAAPLIVTLQTPVQHAGDEPLLLVQETGVPMAVHAKRRDAIVALLAVYPEIELIISDDGLQHYAMARQIEWVVVDSEKQFGNGLLLPAGPLREGVNKLKQTTVVWHGTPPSADRPCTMQLQAGDLHYTTSTLAPPPAKGAVVYALAGIGNPERFFNTLRSMGYNVVALPMPDHHAYSANDLQCYNDHPIITTTKDAVKLQALGIGAWVLPVEAVLSDACYQSLDQQLAAIGVGKTLAGQ